MYLTFDLEKDDDYFQIRVSNHSKINGVDDDAIEKNDNEININIFSSERKKEALQFLKQYFSKINKLAISNNVFINKVEKKVLKTKYSEIVELYLKKIKVDTTRTTKQVKEQVLDKLIKMKPIGTLIKKEYAKSRGMFRLVGQKEHTGIITWIATTGGQVTINRETGSDFSIKKDLHQALLSFVKYDPNSLETFLKSQKK